MKYDIPLVSVVIPTYRRSETIIRAIESILAQTYPNIEILIIDDNGINSEYRGITKELLKEYIDKNKIRYIEREVNGGGSLARNTGINESNGEFIAFLDDDDEYLPDKIQKQYELYLKYKNDNVGIIYCYVNGVNSDGKLIQEYNNDFEGMPLYESMKGCIAGTSTWFCPKKVLLDVKGFENTPSRQDTIMIMKLIKSGYNIYRVPEALINYYEYQGNKISGYSKNTILGEINALNYARKLYFKLENKELVNKIEYEYAKKLLTLYILNNVKSEAKKQISEMIKLYPFKIDTIKGIIKYYLSKMYIKSIEKIRNNRFN